MAESIHDLTKGWGDLSAELDGSRRLLVVDDEPGVLKLFAAVLGPEGYACRFVPTAEQALEAFAAEPADVLITDKNLPGADGLELIRRIHERDPECEAILITGYANLDSALTALDVGATDYLTKPLPHISLLPATVDKALRRRRRRRLSHRMVADLKAVLADRAGDADWAAMLSARRRWELFRDQLVKRRCVFLAQMELRELRPIAELLATHGYSVPLLNRGAEVIARCERGEADVVIIGEELDEMTGLSLFEALVEVPARPELIMASASADLGDVVRAIHGGASGFLLKPVSDLAVVTRAVERGLREQHERLLQIKLVAELQRLAESAHGRTAGAPLHRDLAAALAGFETNTAQVVMRIFESRAGEAEWGSGPAPAKGSGA
jgi:DNA-binding NtrC family response regulator